MAQHVFEKDGRRVFPHHRDGNGYMGDPFILEATVSELEGKELPADTDILQRHGVLNVKPDPQSLYHRPPNSFNDPISVYFVLDALVQARRGSYIRPSYVVRWLSDTVPQIYWSNGVVGRIMAGFYHLCEEMYINDDMENEYLLPEKEGTEDEWLGHVLEAKRRLLPFAQGRDSRGRFYVVDPEGGNEGLVWLMMARRIWLDFAEQAMVDDGDGHHGRNWGSEQAPTDYFMEHMGERARPARAFRNQLQGGATFTRPAMPVKKRLSYGS
jgi:hypothetical protein